MFEAHRLVYRSTLGVRVKQKRKKTWRAVSLKMRSSASCTLRENPSMFSSPSPPCSGSEAGSYLRLIDFGVHHVPRPPVSAGKDGPARSHPDQRCSQSCRDPSELSDWGGVDTSDGKAGAEGRLNPPDPPGAVAASFASKGSLRAEESGVSLAEGMAASAIDPGAFLGIAGNLLNWSGREEGDWGQRDETLYGWRRDTRGRGLGTGLGAVLHHAPWGASTRPAAGSSCWACAPWRFGELR